jgi:hypothetical protein
MAVVVTTAMVSAAMADFDVGPVRANTDPVLKMPMAAASAWCIAVSRPVNHRARRKGAYPFAIRLQCSHAAPIKFSLASGVRNAECADSVTCGSLVRG